jgi:hypothetical protein
MEDDKAKESGEKVMKAVEIADAAARVVGERVVAFEGVAEKFGALAGGIQAAYHSTAAAIDLAHGDLKGGGDHVLSASLSLLGSVVPAIGGTALGYDLVAAGAAHTAGIHIPTSSEAEHTAAVKVAEGAANIVYYDIAHPGATRPATEQPQQPIGQAVEVHNKGALPDEWVKNAGGIPNEWLKNTPAEHVATNPSTTDHDHTTNAGTTDHDHTTNASTTDHDFSGGVGTDHPFTDGHGSD